MYRESTDWREVPTASSILGAETWGRAAGRKKARLCGIKLALGHQQPLPKTDSSHPVGHPGLERRLPQKDGAHPGPPAPTPDQLAPEPNARASKEDLALLLPFSIEQACLPAAPASPPCGRPAQPRTDLQPRERRPQVVGGKGLVGAAVHLALQQERGVGRRASRLRSQESAAMQQPCSSGGGSCPPATLQAACPNSALNLAAPSGPQLRAPLRYISS